MANHIFAVVLARQNLRATITFVLERARLVLTRAVLISAAHLMKYVARVVVFPLSRYVAPLTLWPAARFAVCRDKIAQMVSASRLALQEKRPAGTHAVRPVRPATTITSAHFVRQERLPVAQHVARRHRLA